MKKISFGFNNNDNPLDWSGIGIKDKIDENYELEADYLCSISFENNYYIVAKTNSNSYSKDHKFIVRDAIVDVYADGSTILYLNKEESEISKLISKKLNESGNFDKINDINGVRNCIYNSYPANNSFRLVELNDKIVSISIRNDVFEAKQKAIQSCHNPISNMQIMLNQTRNLKR